MIHFLPTIVELMTLKQKLSFLIVESFIFLLRLLQKVYYILHWYDTKYKNWNLFWSIIWIFRYFYKSSVSNFLIQYSNKENWTFLFLNLECWCIRGKFSCNYMKVAKCLQTRALFLKLPLYVIPLILLPSVWTIMKWWENRYNKPSDGI